MSVKNESPLRSRQAQAEAQVVRAPGLLDHVGGEHAALHRVVGQRVADTLEVAERIDALDVVVGHLGVELVPGLRLHARGDDLGVDELHAGHPHFVDVARQGLRVGDARGVPGGPVVGRDAVAREPDQRGARRLLARVRGVGQAVEIGGRDRAQVGRDQQVARAQFLQRLADVGRGQDARDLVRHAQNARDLFALAQWRADVDRDDHVRAHRARHVNRQVARQAAVDQQPAVDLDRVDDRGNRHARAHRDGQVALADHDHLGRGQVGRDGTERDRQLVEVGAALALGQLAQHRLDRHAGDHALGQRDATVLQTDLGSDVVDCVVDLVAQRDLAAVDVAEQHHGAQPAHLFRDVRQRHAARIRGGDDRAGTRADDHVDRHVQFFHHLQHAQVRPAARAATREHETDAGARRCGLRRGSGRRCLRDRLRQGRHRLHHDAQRDDAAPGRHLA
jgi:hypothetical protein